MNQEYGAIFQALEWVEARTRPQDGIVSNSPYVPFFAQRPSAFLGPGEETIDEAFDRSLHPGNYPYAVVHLHAYGFRPHWIDQIRQRFVPVATFDDPRGRDRITKVVVFRARDGMAVRGRTRQL